MFILVYYESFITTCYLLFIFIIIYIIYMKTRVFKTRSISYSYLL